MRKKGIDILFNTQIKVIEKTDSRFIATTDQGQHLESDLVLYATGRSPNSVGLGLETLGVELDAKGAIKVNEGYQTNIPSLYALGDVTDRLNLTPVATAEAMALVNSLYSDQRTPVDYDNIPTAVFLANPVSELLA